jgi:GT2 family glycosyltransferase
MAAMTGCEPDIAVVIATRNRRDRLVATLQRLSALPERPPVVVVDNASTDGTAAAVARVAPQAKVVVLPVNAAAAGRNAGVAATRAPYVAFCDDDTCWEPGSLGRAARYLRRDPRIDIVAGHVVVDPDGRSDPACELMRTSPLPPVPGLRGTPVLGFLAGGSMVRRSSFVAAGGFNPRLGIGGEEQLLALDIWRRGGVVTYAPDVVVRHQPYPRTDQAHRARLQRRNALWCVWLRYRRQAVWRETLAVLQGARHDPEARAALGQAVRGLPWVLRQRRAIPPDVAELVRLCEAQARGELSSRGAA